MVRVLDWGSPVLLGSVSVVEPYAFTKVSALGIEEQRAFIHVDLLHSHPALGHGYGVRLDTVVWSSEDVVRVPLTALFKSNDDWTVFRVENGRAHKTTVEIGHMSRNAAEILAGVLPGDVLIEHPSNRVEGGVKVKVRAISDRLIETQDLIPTDTPPDAPSTSVSDCLVGTSKPVIFPNRS